MAVDAQGDAALDLLGRDQPAAELDDGADVLRGLQQARDELELVGTDQLRRRLEPEVGVEPAGQYVAEAVPPAGVVRIARKSKQPLALFGVVDAVQREQVADVAFLETDPAQLHPADLGLRRADLPAGIGPGDSGRLTHSPQVCAEDDPQRGRPAWRARLRHTHLRRPSWIQNGGLPTPTNHLTDGP
ncbi:hypothetical protein GCM10009554_47480 [Kribbella koreensis]|uniref:Uncharacterized protein n=1 Tax=Kribbella koreensis TaxID=57909 RepID=A0ABN1QY76_9ACTN